MLIYLLSGFVFGWEMLAVMLAYLISLVIAFSFHEFAHSLTAYRFGDMTPKARGRLTLNPAAHIDVLGLLCLLFLGFGWAKPVEVNPLKFKRYKLAMSLVSVAGVLTNLTLAFLFSGLYFFGSTFNWFASTTMIVVFFKWLLLLSVSINLTLFVFNLLPIYPLDGFNLIRTFLGAKNKFLFFMMRYGVFILLAILITPVFSILHSYVTEFFLGVFNVFWGLFI